MGDSRSETVPERSPQRIVCAAIRHSNGSIICGPRHFDALMRSQIFARKQGEEWRGAEQGFVNQFGEFLTREQAYEIADTNGQHLHGEGYDGRLLFSEDLY